MKISSGLFHPGAGDCAKQKVTAILIPKNYDKLTYGDHYSHYISTNFCLSPQITCPRERDEGYEKCKSICNQPNHAEVNVLQAAGEKAKGSIVIVIGHYHCCEDCVKAMTDAGIEEVIIIER